MNLWQSGPCILCTSNIGSLGQRAIWNTHVIYPLLWNEYWRIWPSLGCLGSQKRRHPSGRLWFFGSLDPAPYVPAISAPWVKGLFGTHMLHTLCYGMNIGVYGTSLGCLVSQKRRRPSGRLWFFGSLDHAPYVPAISAPWVKGLFGTHMLHTLCCGMNIGVYGQVWGSLVPRNEDVPLADCNFMAVWSLHPMYQQYWLPGSKVYLVNTCYIPSVVEWILAYMAQDWDALVPRIEGVPLADYDFMAVWSLHPMYQQYRLPGSKGYSVHTCYIPSVVERILAYMAKFGVPWCPETKTSLWQIVILWQSGPAPHVPAILAPWVKGLFGKHMLHTLCCGMNIGICGTRLGRLGSQNRRRPSGWLWLYGSLVPAPYVPAISAPWVKGLFGTHMLHTLCCGKNIGVYGQVWGDLVPRNEGVPLADCDSMAVWTLHPMYQQYRLPGSNGYLVHTCYISSLVEWILAYMAKFGVPWFQKTKASFWQIKIIWQSGPCSLCTSNIGSLGQRAIWYTHVTYPLLWNEYWHIWHSLGCLGSQKRRRPCGRLRVYRIPDTAPYVPAIPAPWVKGLFGTHILHTLCCGMNIGVYGQVWGALVPRNEGVPLADCDFMAFWSLHPMYQQYRLPGSKGYLVNTCYIPSVVEWILAYMAQGWDALVPRIEVVPLKDYDFMAVWTLHPTYQQYRLPGSKGYLVHTCYIPSVVE